MPIDTSMYAPQPAPNYLGQMQNLLQMQTQQNQNKLFQQEFAGRQGMGNAFAGAIGSGGVNYDQLNKDLAGGAAGFLTPQALEAQQALKNAGLTGTGQALEQSKARLTNYYGALAPLVAGNKAPTYKDIVSLAANQVSLGMLQPEEFAAIATQVPRDPEGARQWAIQRTQMAMSPDQVTAPTPAPPNPLTGTPRTYTRGAQIQALTPPVAYKAKTNDGRSVDVDASGNAIPNQNTAPTLPAGLSPAAEANYKKSGDQWNDFGKAQSVYSQQIYQQKTALDALNKTNTGPGTEFRNQLQSVLFALPGGIGRWLPGVNGESVKAYDEANKYLTASAAGTPNAGKSNEQLDTALASNPSVHISGDAAKDIVKANIGFRRAEMAAHAIYSSAKNSDGSPKDGSDFTNWYADWNKNIDPRAFSVDLQDPKTRAEYYKGLSDKSVGGLPSPKQRFRDSLRAGIQAGVIDSTSLTGGTNAPPK